MNKEGLDVAMLRLASKQAEEDKNNILNHETEVIDAELVRQLGDFLAAHIEPDSQRYQNELEVNLGKSKLPGLGHGQILMRAKAFKQESGIYSRGSLFSDSSERYTHISISGTNFQNADAINLSFSFLAVGSVSTHFGAAEPIASEYYGEGSELRYIARYHSLGGHPDYDTYAMIDFDSADEANRTARLRQQQLPETMELIANAAANSKLNPKLATVLASA